MAISRLEPFGLQFGTDKNNKTKADLDTYLNIVTDKLEEIKTFLENLPRRRIIPKLAYTNCFVRIGGNGKTQLVSKLPAKLRGKLDSDKIIDRAITANKFSPNFKLKTTHLSSNFALENRHFRKQGNNQSAVILVNAETFINRLPISKFNDGCFTERTLQAVRLTSKKIDNNSIYPRHFANNFTLGKQKTGEHILHNYFAVADLSSTDVNYKIIVPNIFDFLSVYINVYNYVNLRLVLDYQVIILEHAECQDSILHTESFLSSFANDFCCITVHNAVIDEQYFLKDAVGYSIELENVQVKESEAALPEEGQGNTQHYEITLSIHAEFIIPTEVKGINSNNEGDDDEDNGENESIVDFTITGFQPFKIDSYDFTSISATACMKCTITKNVSKNLEPAGLINREVVLLESTPTKKYNVTESLTKSKLDANTYKIEAEYKKVNNELLADNKNNPKEYGNTVMLLEKNPTNNTINKLSSNVHLYKESDTEQITINKNAEITINQNNTNNIINGISTVNKEVNTGLVRISTHIGESKEEQIDDSGNIITTNNKNITQVNSNLLNNNEKINQYQISTNSIEDNNVKLENKEITGNIGQDTINYNIETTYEKNLDNNNITIKKQINGQVITDDNNVIQTNTQESLISNASENKYTYTQMKTIQYPNEQHIININEHCTPNKVMNGFTDNLTIVKQTEINYQKFDKDGDKISGEKQFIIETHDTITIQGVLPSNNIIQKAESLLLNTDDEEDIGRNKVLEMQNIENDAIIATGAKFNLENILPSLSTYLTYNGESLQSKTDKYKIEAGTDNIAITSENPTEALQELEVSLDSYRNTESILVSDVNSNNDNYEKYRIRREVWETKDEIVDYTLKYTEEELENLGDEAKNKVIPVFTPVLTSVNYKEIALEADLARKEDENKELTNKINELTAEVTEHNIDLTNKNAKINELANEISRLEKLHARYQTECRQQIKEINILKKQLKRLNENQQEEKNQLTSRIQQLTREYNMVKAQSDTKISLLAKEKDKLLQATNSLQTEQQEMSLQIATLTNKLEDQRNLETNLRNINLQRSKEIKDLTTKINQLNSTLSKEQKKYSELEKKQFETEEQKAAELNKQLQIMQNLEQAIKTYTRENNEYKQQLQNYEQKIDILTQDKKDLMTELEQQRQQQEQLDQRFNKQEQLYTAKINVQEQDLNKLKNQYEQLKNESKINKRLISHLKKSMQERAHQIDSNNTKISKLQTQLDNVAQENETRVKELTEEINQYETIKASDEKEKAEISNTLTQSRRQLNRTQEALSLMANRVKLKEEQLNELKEEVKSLQTSLDREKQEKRKLNTLTKQQQKDLREYRAYKDKYDISQKEKNALQNNIKQLDSKIETITAEQARTGQFLLLYEQATDEYNKLLQRYKTNKIKQEEFTRKKQEILQILNTAPNKILSGKTASYNWWGKDLKRSEQSLKLNVSNIGNYTRQEIINKIKGLKDTLEVGGTLPSIQRTIEYDITENKDGKTLNKLNKLIDDNMVSIQVKVLEPAVRDWSHFVVHDTEKMWANPTQYQQVSQLNNYADNFLSPNYRSQICICCVFKGNVVYQKQLTLTDYAWIDGSVQRVIDRHLEPNAEIYSGIKRIYPNISLLRLMMPGRFLGISKASISITIFRNVYSYASYNRRDIYSTGTLTSKHYYTYLQKIPISVVLSILTDDIVVRYQDSRYILKLSNALALSSPISIRGFIERDIEIGYCPLVPYR